MTKIYFILFFPVLFMLGCSVSNNPQRCELKMLQKGIIKARGGGVRIAQSVA